MAITIGNQIRIELTVTAISQTSKGTVYTLEIPEDKKGDEFTLMDTLKVSEKVLTRMMYPV